MRRVRFGRRRAIAECPAKRQRVTVGIDGARAAERDAAAGRAAVRTVGHRDGRPIRRRSLRNLKPGRQQRGLLTGLDRDVARPNRSRRGDVDGRDHAGWRFDGRRADGDAGAEDDRRLPGHELDVGRTGNSHLNATRATDGRGGAGEMNLRDVEADSGALFAGDGIADGQGRTADGKPRRHAEGQAPARRVERGDRLAERRAGGPGCRRERHFVVRGRRVESGAGDAHRNRDRSARRADRRQRACQEHGGEADAHRKRGTRGSHRQTPAIPTVSRVTGSARAHRSVERRRCVR